MVDEKRFDYDKYIQERLREIDDLDERRPDSLAARYLQKSGRFLQTPAELGRKVQEFAGGYRMEMAGFEILEKAEEGFLSGDMNGFTGARVFTDDRRKVLLIRLRQA